MKNIGITTALIGFLALPLQAETVNVTKSMEKIKTNVESSKKNKQAIDKSLIYILANIDELQKTETKTVQQKNVISNDLNRNREMLKKISQQEKQLQSLIAKETEKLEYENAQLEQLQNLLQHIKNNQAQRQQIIENYQKQLKDLKIAQNAWADREKNVAVKNSELEGSLKTINNQKNTWTQNKIKNQTESNKWATEIKRQQQIHDTYTALIQQK